MPWRRELGRPRTGIWHPPRAQVSRLICGEEAQSAIVTNPACRQGRLRAGLVTVTRVRHCPVINRQVHGDECGVRPSWEVVHGSGSGSMRAMARHGHGCDTAVNRHSSDQTSSDWYWCPWAEEKRGFRPHGEVCGWKSQWGCSGLLRLVSALRALRAKI